MEFLEKQQAETRRKNTGAHLIHAARALEKAANAGSWTTARGHLLAAAQSLKNAGATEMGS